MEIGGGTRVAPPRVTMFTRRITILALAAGTVALVAGCTGRATYRATASTTYSKPSGYAYVHTQPRMALVHDGVWVVEDRSHPVFYSHGHYYRYDSGVWYRSSYVNDGFVRVRVGAVPRAVLRIDRPRRYVHYHAPARRSVRVVPRGHIHGQVRVRHDDDRHRRIDRDRGHRGRGIGHHRGRGRGHHRRH